MRSGVNDAYGNRVFCAQGLDRRYTGLIHRCTSDGGQLVHDFYVFRHPGWARPIRALPLNQSGPLIRVYSRRTVFLANKV